jgi:hypothetical protein
MPIPIADLTRIDLSAFISALDAIEGRIWSPWAVLLVRFQDDPSPDPPLTKYNDLFTAAGSGRQNMVDFFRDMSHGVLDLTGTRVFGWFTLPANRTDYVGNVYPQPAGKLNRNGLLDLAKSSAAAASVPLGDFAGVVVSARGNTDLCGWIGGMAALCDEFSLSPSLLGQEMGHGYGLDHARINGSTADYRDPWDVMSTAAYPAMQAPHPEFGTVGPGLNAWNMRSRGWLKDARVWSSTTGHVDELVTLRPLHRVDLPGYLAAQIGEYFVEFRVPQNWDAAIPRSCVLVHTFSDNHSYLMPAFSGSQDIVAGDKFQAGNPTVSFAPSTSVEVTQIDEHGLSATVRIQHWPAKRVPLPVGTPIGSVEVDGPGWLIVGGRIVPVPPRGPDRQLVEAVVQYLQIGISTAGVQAALQGRRDALVEVVRQAVGLHSATDLVSETPPGYQAQKGQQA